MQFKGIQLVHCKPWAGYQRVRRGFYLQKLSQSLYCNLFFQRLEFSEKASKAWRAVLRDVSLGGGLIKDFT